MLQWKHHQNVKGVKVPNSNGLKGIDVAATLGVVGGCAERELEVLEDVTEADIEKTKELVQQGFCTCTLKEGVENLYIVAKVIAGEHSAEVTIVNRHTLISRIVKMVRYFIKLRLMKIPLNTLIKVC